MTTEQLIDALKHGTPLLTDPIHTKALGNLLETLIVRVARLEQQAKLDRATVSRVKSGSL